MATIFLPARRRRAPQHPVLLNHNSPFAENLAVLVNPGSGPRNLVTQTPLTISGTLDTCATSHGRSWQGAASAYLDLGALSPGSAGCTILQIVNPLGAGSAFTVSSRSATNTNGVELLTDGSTMAFRYSSAATSVSSGTAGAVGDGMDHVVIGRYNPSTSAVVIVDSMSQISSYTTSVPASITASQNLRLHSRGTTYYTARSGMIGYYTVPISPSHYEELLNYPYAMLVRDPRRLYFDGAAGASDSVTLTDLTNGRIYQRSGTSLSIPISGTYTGSPTTIEARIVTAGTSTEIVTWTEIDATPAGGTFSGNITVPQGGLYNVQVRFSNDTGITSNGSASWGVGSLYAIIGQSNAFQWFTIGSGSAHASTRKFDGTWATNTGAGAITFANALQTAQSIPVGLLDYGVDGAGLTAAGDRGSGYWADSTPGEPYPLFAAGLTAAGGKLEGVIWAQGESDALNSVSGSSYASALTTLCAQIRTDTGQAALPIFIAPLGRTTHASATDSNWQAIKDALLSGAAATNNYLAAQTHDLTMADTLHYDATGYANFATRAALRVQEVLGLTTNSRGPTIKSAEIVDTTHIDVAVTLRGGSTITPASSITGFRVLDAATPATISSAARQSATSVRLTLSSALSNTATVQYGYGKNPTVTGPVYDDSANTLPLEITNSTGFLANEGVTVTGNGVWTWYNDERVRYYNGSYYVGYINSSGDVCIAKLVAATGVITSFTLSAALQVDDHDNPSIFILSNGKIAVAYSKHSTGHLYTRLSTNAEDISAWGAAVDANGVNSSYGNIYQCGSYYWVFYRAASDWSYYAVRTSDFVTYGSPVKVVENAPERPYSKYAQNGTTRIDCFYNDGHPNEVTNNNCYHIYFTESAGALVPHKSDGTSLTLPVTAADGTLVFDATGGSTNAWVHQIRIDGDGRPRVLFARFETTTDHRAMFARWTGSAWTTPVQIATLGTRLYAAELYYSGGMCFDGNNTNRVFLSRESGGVWNLSEWESGDTGATWSQTRAITAGATVNARPFSPVGHAGVAVFWWKGAYASYTSYNTDIVGAAGDVDYDSTLVTGTLDATDGADDAAFAGAHSVAVTGDLAAIDGADGAEFSGAAAGSVTGTMAATDGADAAYFYYLASAAPDVTKIIRAIRPRLG